MSTLSKQQAQVKNNSDGSHKHTFPGSATCGQHDLKYLNYVLHYINAPIPERNP